MFMFVIIYLLCAFASHVLTAPGNNTMTATQCFQCKTTNSCIILLLVCDGMDDCGDYSDESKATCPCSSDQFVCDNGRCIPQSWVCDNEDDCYDGSDENGNCSPCHNNGGCNHICKEIKTDAGVTTGKECSCKDGFYLRKDGVTCYDEDECTTKGICEGRCINTVGSYKCECGYGFKQGADQKTCEDINECEVNNGGCKHLCHNTHGDYHCSCKSGYNQNYRNPKHCDDVDECAFGIPRCHVCRNIAGGYKCTCDSGFSQNPNKTACLDNDECEKNNGGCAHLCDNLPGSFQCRCKSGFEATPFGSNSCSDIDECAANNGTGPCAQSCTNKPGSYSCECGGGYTLANDGHTCEDVDECALPEKRLCDHKCVNTNGGYYCDCNSGYFLAKDGKTCGNTIDYSECGIMRQGFAVTKRWKDSNRNEWPWVVHVSMVFHLWATTTMPINGVLGVILSEKWILTAGHSLEQEGSYNVHTNNGGSISIAEIIPYSNCDVERAQCKSDIALVKLSRSIKFSRNVRPICIPDVRRQRSMTGRSNNGMILRRVKTSANGMQERTVRKRGYRDCKHYPFSRHMICAGDAANECAGDSGSPLMYDTKEKIHAFSAKHKYIAYLGGVLSWGRDILNDSDSDIDEDCSAHPRYLAYTNISKYLKWIEEKTGVKPRAR